MIEKNAWQFCKFYISGGLIAWLWNAQTWCHLLWARPWFLSQDEHIRELFFASVNYFINASVEPVKPLCSYKMLVVLVKLFLVKWNINVSFADLFALSQ